VRWKALGVGGMTTGRGQGDGFGEGFVDCQGRVWGRFDCQGLGHTAPKALFINYTLDLYKDRKCALFSKL